eukprot:3112264-Amphidinium_carterae.1
MALPLLSGVRVHCRGSILLTAPDSSFNSAGQFGIGRWGLVLGEPVLLGRKRMVDLAAVVVGFARGAYDPQDVGPLLHLLQGCSACQDSLDWDFRLPLRYSSPPSSSQRLDIDFDSGAS